MKISLPQKFELWSVDKLKPYEKNARTHSAEQVAKIASSILQFGFNSPILIDSNSGIIAGHGRLEAAKSLGMAEVPVVVVDHLTEQQKRAYILADNKLQELGGWDRDLLTAELEALKDDGFDIATTGFSDAELERALAFLPEDLPMAEGTPQQQTLAGTPAAAANDNGGTLGAIAGNESDLYQKMKDGDENKKKLSDSFIVPPFSVLDCRQGYWQERKRAWLTLGIASEVGRGGNLLGMSETVLQPDPDKREAGDIANAGAGTSIFDPVLCELAYRWFSPKDGIVLDPFAGGSVRGIVASKLGRQYFGCDLRPEQIEANQVQAKELCEAPLPKWKAGDSREIKKHFKGVEADLIFSCPPYADLEVYSDDKRDLSTLEYQEFKKAYAEIIANAVAMLKPDRFAVFVVGEVREKNKAGFYNNFVLDTIHAFEDAGARFYNEIVLVTSVGTLALRAGRVFSASRKIGKTHQNVLVFCKGDPWKAVAACGDIDVTLPEGMEPANDNEGPEQSTAVQKTDYGELVTTMGDE